MKNVKTSWWPWSNQSHLFVRCWTTSGTFEFKIRCSQGLRDAEWKRPSGFHVVHGCGKPAANEGHVLETWGEKRRKKKRLPKCVTDEEKQQHWCGCSDDSAIGGQPLSPRQRRTVLRFCVGFICMCLCAYVLVWAHTHTHTTRSRYWDNAHTWWSSGLCNGSCKRSKDSFMKIKSPYHLHLYLSVVIRK